ncbi:MAG: hypothetical protein ABIC18_04495 [Candidatus Omnitrophota bacterium]
MVIKDKAKKDGLMKFTPLEKATDKVGGGKNIDADGSLKQNVSPIRNKISNGVRESSSVMGRSSLTGFTFKVPLRVVVKKGKNWLEMQEVK